LPGCIAHAAPSEGPADWLGGTAAAAAADIVRVGGHHAGVTGRHRAHTLMTDVCRTARRGTTAAAAPKDVRADAGTAAAA